MDFSNFKWKLTKSDIFRNVDKDIQNVKIYKMYSTMSVTGLVCFLNFSFPLFPCYLSYGNPSRGYDYWLHCG